MVILAEALALPLSQIFVNYDAALLELTVSGLRIYALSFFFMGYAIFCSGLFTALNDGVISAIISFLRTLVFQTASVMLLPLIWDIDGIWYSVAAAELMAVALSAFFLVKKRKHYHY
jgi:Na+-driven multidrug efflux pump